MCLKTCAEIIDRFVLPDFNRQFVVNFFTHKTKGLASIFILEFREFSQTFILEVMRVCSSTGLCLIIDAAYQVILVCSGGSNTIFKTETVHLTNFYQLFNPCGSRCRTGPAYLRHKMKGD